MAIFTAAEIAEQKTAYKAALAACSQGRAYSVGSRSLTRHDLPEIRATLEWLDQQEQALAGQAGPHFVTGRPRR
ncbi:MAG: hypothetical protein KQJ78_20590 [Deltaproteobacteria bacterium]|nr:hypothetical protein [Deltaproteobacteria bacterium]